MAIRKNSTIHAEHDKFMSQVNSWYSYFTEQINTYKSDKDFVYKIRGQWSDTEQKEFNDRKKPALQLNVIRPALEQIVGELLPSLPSVSVTSNGQDTDDAQLREDIIQTVFYDSDAQEVFSQSLLDQMFGFGAFRIKTEHEEGETFNQKIKLVKIETPYCAYFDPAATDKTKQNGKFSGFYEQVGKAEFDARGYGVSFDDVKRSSKEVKSQIVGLWYNGNEDTVSICYHYVKEYKLYNIIELDNGEVIKESDLEDFIANIPPGQSEPEIRQKRKVSSCNIKCYELCADRILDEYDWPSQLLPIAFVDGNSINIDGRQEIQSFIKNAKDPQRVTNYVYSEIATQIKYAVRPRFMMTPQQVKGHEMAYKRPEDVISYYMYNNVNNQPTPPYIAPPPFSAELSNRLQQCISEVWMSLGRNSAAQGAADPKVAWQTVLMNITQNNHAVRRQYLNLMDAVKLAGQIILDLTNPIYANARQISLIKEDGSRNVVSINGADGTAENMITEAGHTNYHLQVKAGAPSEIERNAQFEKLMSLIPVLENPALQPYADLILKDAKIMSYEQFIERWSNLLPPELKAQIQGIPPQPQPTPPNPLAVAAVKEKEANAFLKNAQAQSIAVKTRNDITLEPQKLELEQQKINAGIIDSQLKAQISNEKAQAEVTKAVTDATTNVHEANMKLASAVHTNNANNRVYHEE